MRTVLFLVLAVSASGVSARAEDPGAVTYLGRHLLPRTDLVVRGEIVSRSRLGTGTILARLRVDEVLRGRKGPGVIVVLSSDPTYFPEARVPTVFFLRRLGEGRFEPEARMDLTGASGTARLETLRSYLEIEALADRSTGISTLHDLLMKNLASDRAFMLWSAARELAHFTEHFPEAFDEADLEGIEAEAASTTNVVLKELLSTAARNLGSLARPAPGVAASPERRAPRKAPPPPEFRQLLALWRQGTLNADEREMLLGAACVRYLKYAAPMLLEAVHDEDARIRGLAVRYLGEGLFPEGEEPLMLLLATEKDADVVEAAIQSLGILKSEKALPAILRHAPNPATRRTVAFALARIRTPEALEHLGGLRLEVEREGISDGEGRLRKLIEYLLSDLFLEQEKALEKVRRKRLR